jgi:LacI family transcriptional regulator
MSRALPNLGVENDGGCRWGCPVAANLHPALTTVALPHYEMGAWAAGQLIDAIEGTATLEDAAREPTLLDCPLVVRDSVAAPKA